MYKVSIKNIIFNKVNRFLIHLRNYISFVSFVFLKIFIKRRNNNTENKTILFFNNGQIGDLLVSSVILENEENLSKNYNYVLLIKEEYIGLFERYEGIFKIKTYNLSKYKFNIKYKVKLIKELNDLGIFEFYNLCAARGIMTEELSYFINTEKKVALNIDSFYLDKFLLKYFNKIYSKLLFERKKNEYEKIIGLINILHINDTKFIASLNEGKLFNCEASEGNYIVIAPFTSDMFRNWGIKNFMELINRLSVKYNIVILGSSKDENIPIDKENAGVKNLIGKTTLAEAASLIANAKMFVGNDSGLTHLALKFNKPIIALIGGGMWGRFFPFNVNKKAYFYANKMNCFGCEWICFYKYRYCVTSIYVDEIENAVIKLYENL